MTALAPTLQAFFTDRLIGQRGASRHTIAAYRDTWRLLLGFAAQRTGKNRLPARHRRPRRPADRRVPRPPRTRARQQRPHPQQPAGRDPLPVRLRRAAPPRARRRHPAGAGDPAQAVPAQPGHLPHRAPRSTPCSPRRDQRTWTGRRDHAMLVLAAQTGLRISELTGLTCADIHLGAGAHVALPSAKAARTGVTPLTARHRRGAARLARRTRAARPATRCSPPAPAGRSAATRSNGGSPCTPPPPPRPARRCAASTSPPTRCGTPPP